MRSGSERDCKRYPHLRESGMSVRDWDHTNTTKLTVDRCRDRHGACAASIHMAKGE